MKYVVLAFVLVAGCSYTTPPPELQTYGVLMPSCVLVCKASVAATEAEGGGSATGVISTEPPVVTLP